MAKENSFGLKEVADLYLIPYTIDALSYVSGSSSFTSPFSSEDRLCFVSENSYVPNEFRICRKFPSPINQTKVLYEIHNPAKWNYIDKLVESKGLFKFDSLKVSNVEVSSEDTYAKGGKGNTDLIGWNYGKEVTLTLENALIDMPTLNLMMGVDKLSFIAVGTTVARNYSNGKDYLFTFVIPKCKLNVGATLTMEAEGDPSTFEMTIKAMTSDVQIGTFYDGDGHINYTNEKDALILFFRKPTPKSS